MIFWQMMPAQSLHDYVLSQVTELLKSKWRAPRRLELALRLLAKYRSTMLHHAMIEKYGPCVLAGPFAGMQLPPDNEEGCMLPKLLGCYEAELHPCWERAKNSGYETILDIGCGDGYYAIGLSRLIPEVEIRAYDINQKVLRVCQRMAKVNGVSPHLVNTEFSGADFAHYADRKTMMVCDIEGGETDLLDPARFPALGKIDLVVELHQTKHGHAVDIVPPRFADTHQIEILYPGGRDIVLPEMFRSLSNLDQLLAVWEWRTMPTPWAIMHSLRPAGRS